VMIVRAISRGVKQKLVPKTLDTIGVSLLTAENVEAVTVTSPVALRSFRKAVVCASGQGPDKKEVIASRTLFGAFDDVSSARHLDK
jgi:hypothetical protein